MTTICQPLVTHELRVNIFDLERRVVHFRARLLAPRDEKAMVIDVFFADIHAKERRHVERFVCWGVENVGGSEVEVLGVPGACAVVVVGLVAKVAELVNHRWTIDHSRVVT